MLDGDCCPPRWQCPLFPRDTAALALGERRDGCHGLLLSLFLQSATTK